MSPLGEDWRNFLATPAPAEVLRTRRMTSDIVVIHFIFFLCQFFFKSYKKRIQGTTGEKLTNIDKHLPNSHGPDTALAIQDKSR